jgi:Uma2 family endonuclease
MTHAEAILTLDEFLTLEQRSQVHHEYVAGRLHAMSGGTERHELLKDAIYRRWAGKAFGDGCRAFTGRMLKVPAGNVYYPDGLIVRDRAAHSLYEDDATVVVEVLSPSTRDIDRREKVAAYSRLPSLAMYVVVEPLLRRIEVATWTDGRIDWNFLGPSDVLISAYGDIAVDDLYNEVDAIASS